jgi:hypothetical protein
MSSEGEDIRSSVGALLRRTIASRTIAKFQEPTPVSVKEAACSHMRFGPSFLRILVSFGVLVRNLSFPPVNALGRWCASSPQLFESLRRA